MSGTCVGRGIRAGLSLGQAREKAMEKDTGGTVDKEGGGQGIYVVKEKRRGSAVHAFPDQAAAKPRGSNRTTEIPKYKGFNVQELVKL